MSGAAATAAAAAAAAAVANGGGASGLTAAAAISLHMGSASTVTGALPAGGKGRRHVMEVARLGRGDMLNGTILLGRATCFHVVTASQVGAGLGGSGPAGVWRRQQYCSFYMPQCRLGFGRRPYTPTTPLTSYMTLARLYISVFGHQPH